MLKFEEVAKENREAQESNNVLKTQLHAEQQNVQQLNAQIDTLRQNEEELKAREVEHDKKMTTAKTRCEQASSSAQKAQLELDNSRKEKLDIDAKLKDLQRTTHDVSSCASELTDLQDRLRQVTDDLERKKKEVTSLESECAQLKASNAELKLHYEQQASEISQHSSRIESLQEENEAERQEERKQGRAAIELAEKQERTILKGIDDLQAKLEQAQLRESKASSTHAALVIECDTLRNQMTELEATQAAKDMHLDCVCEKKDEEVRKCREDLDNWRRRCESSEAALKEAQAKIQFQKTEHHKEVEYDEQKYKAIVQTLEKELDKVKAEAASSHNALQTSLPVTSPHAGAAHSLQNPQTGKGRKKVNRDNRTVLDVTKLSGAHKPSATSHQSPLASHTDAERNDNLFDEITQDGTIFLMDPAARQVEDTEEIAGPMMDFYDAFTIQAGQEASGESKQRQSTSDESSLSSASPEEIAQMLADSQSSMTSKTRNQSENSDKEPLSQQRVAETPPRSIRPSASNFRSPNSTGRPRSQANTASRMMPPPGMISNFENRKPDSNNSRTSRKAMYEKRDHTSGSRDEESSDSAHQSSPLQPLYAKDSSNMTDYSGQPNTNSQSTNYTPSGKRKSIEDPDVPFKRQRNTPGSYDASSSSGSRTQLPYYTQRSTGGTRSRQYVSSVQVSASPTANTRSRGQPGQGLLLDQAPRSRNQQSSTPRSSAATRTSRVTYGRQSTQQSSSSHRTRSKSRWSSMF
jgi:chromosome segregation ATPase